MTRRKTDNTSWSNIDPGVAPGTTWDLFSAVLTYSFL